MRSHAADVVAVRFRAGLGWVHTAAITSGVAAYSAPRMQKRYKR